MTTVDIVIPVYNEEADIARNVPVLRDFLAGPEFPYNWRIVIGDNASTDGTGAVSRDLEQNHPGEVAYYRTPHKGKGRVIRDAWLASDADIVSFMDVDLATGLDAFPALIRAIAEDGYDIAIGSRLLRGSKVRRSLKRRILTRGYNLLVRGLFRTSFGDAQCGFKAASRGASQALLPLVQDLNWFFDTELLLLAEKKGYRIKQVPVTWAEDESTSVRMVSTIATDLNGLFRMWRTRPWREGDNK